MATWLRRGSRRPPARTTARLPCVIPPEDNHRGEGGGGGEKPQPTRGVCNRPGGAGGQAGGGGGVDGGVSLFLSIHRIYTKPTFLHVAAAVDAPGVIEEVAEITDRRCQKPGNHPLDKNRESERERDEAVLGHGAEDGEEGRGLGQEEEGRRPEGHRQGEHGTAVVVERNNRQLAVVALSK